MAFRERASGALPAHRSQFSPSTLPLITTKALISVIQASFRPSHSTRAHGWASSDSGGTEEANTLVEGLLNATTSVATQQVSGFLNNFRMGSMAQPCGVQVGGCSCLRYRRVHMVQVPSRHKQEEKMPYHPSPGSIWTAIRHIQASGSSLDVHTLRCGGCLQGATEAAQVPSSGQVPLQRTWQDWTAWSSVAAAPAATAAATADGNTSLEGLPSEPCLSSQTSRQGKARAWVHLKPQLQHLIASTKAAAKTMRSQPRTLLWPLLLFMLCLGLGVLGVEEAARQHIQEEKAVAQSAANQAALELDLVLRASVSPLKAAAGLVKITYQDPAALNSSFIAAAPELLGLAVNNNSMNAVFLLVLAPQGVIQWVYDPNSSLGNTSFVGIDILKEPWYR